jgi:hypothetical protein
MPHIRKLKVGTPADKPNEMVVSVWIPRAMKDFRSIDDSLAELEQELSKRYPVKRVRRSRRMGTLLIPCIGNSTSLSNLPSQLSL